MKVGHSTAPRADLRPAKRTGPTGIRVLGSASNEATLKLVEGWRRLGLPARAGSAAEALATVEPGDVVVARLDVLPTLDGVEPGLLALLWIERRGVRVVNTAAALLAAHDKLRTARLLTAAGVPHPRTAALTAGRAPPLRPPLVLKPRFGSWGRDVFLCEDDRALDRCLHSIRERPWFRRHGAIVQDVIPPLGHDLRVVVAGGRVVGATERVAAPGEWRTNVSLGGSHRPVRVTPEAEQLARAAAAAIGAELVGVDLMPIEAGETEARHVVLELNGAVEFDQTYARAGGDIYADIAGALALAGDDGVA